jgi:hypothetical protein
MAGRKAGQAAARGCGDGRRDLFRAVAVRGLFDGSAGQRLVAIAAVVAAGSAVYFVIAWFSGAMDREDLLILLRRKKVTP